MAETRYAVKADQSGGQKQALSNNIRTWLADVWQHVAEKVQTMRIGATCSIRDGKTGCVLTASHRDKHGL